MLLQRPQINPSSAVAVQPELVPGESFVWAGQPKTSVVFHKEGAILIPFSLLWGGFAIFWEANVLGIWSAQAHAPWTFGVLWGIPFVLIGQYLIWGRFFYTAWLKRRTHYAVTNRRAIVVQDGRLCFDVADSFDKEFDRVVRWAADSRAAIHEKLELVFGMTELLLDLPHNTYEQLADGGVIIRKGSVRLLPGELSVLPSHMSGDVVVVRARDNKHSQFNEPWDWSLDV